MVRFNLGVLGVAALLAAGLSVPASATPLRTAPTAGGVWPGIVKVSKDDEKKRLAAQQKAAKQREQALAAQLEGVNASIVEMAVTLERTKSEIPMAQTRLKAAQDRKAAAEAEHAAIQSRLDIANAQKNRIASDIKAGEAVIAHSEVTIGQIARQRYRGGKLNDSLWSMLMDSSSIDELTRRAQAASTLTHSQNQVILEAQEATAANVNARARQEAVTERIGELEAKAAQAVSDAAAAQAEEQRHLQSIQDLQSQQLSQQRQLNSQRQAFQDQIQREQQTQAQAAARIAQLNGQAATLPARTISGGIFGAPLSSLQVTSPYGYRTHPILGRRIFHSGTDLAAGCGTPIFASQSGTVAFRGWDGTGGNSIYINHGRINGSAWQTAYRHLSAFNVSKGASVSKGQVIGKVGTTGRSTGCHLHFEVWQNGKTINSMGVL